MYNILAVRPNMVKMLGQADNQNDIDLIIKQFRIARKLTSADGYSIRSPFIINVYRKLNTAICPKTDPNTTEWVLCIYESDSVYELNLIQYNFSYNTVDIS